MKNLKLWNPPLTFITLFAIFMVLFSQPVLSQQVGTSIGQDLSRTYGFYIGQEASIEYIKVKYPALAANAAKWQMEFDLVFKSPYENIETTLHAMLAERWTEYKRNLQRQISDNLKSVSFSEEQAIAFIQEVEHRAKGMIESPVLETLLIHNVQYQKNPEEEFLRGFSSIYRTKGHAKAKGIDFQVQYPKSWRAKEGQRPNVVQLMTSENGRGLDSIVLMVKDLPLPPGHDISEQELNDLFSTQSMKEMIPDGASFVTAKAVILDRQKGGMVIFDQTQERVDTKLSLRIMQFVTLYKNKMIFLQCMTATPVNSQAQLNERYRKMEPLFKLVANSFVIQDQY